MSQNQVLDSELITLLDRALASGRWSKEEVRALAQSGDGLRHVKNLIGGNGLFLPVCGIGPVSLKVPIPKWREDNGVISFNVTSDGTTGRQWRRRLADGGYRISRNDGVSQILYSDDFQPTSGVLYEIAVLKGEDLAASCKKPREKWDISKVHAAGESRGLTLSPPEVACLILEKFCACDFKDMGFQFMEVMHTPALTEESVPFWLSIRPNHRQLDVSNGVYGGGWENDVSFAFVTSRIGG